MASQLMPGLEVTLARPDEQTALASLVQLYIHDFTEFWTGTPRGELQADGRFAMYPLEPYWDEPGRVPLFVWRDGHLAGFALLNTVTHSGLPADRNMAEFFIVRKHRRGRAVAREIFSRYPGVWEVAIARRNIPAQAFWRGAVGGHPTVRNLEEFDMFSTAWDGPVLRFRIAA